MISNLSANALCTQICKRLVTTLFLYCTVFLLLHTSFTTVFFYDSPFGVFQPITSPAAFAAHKNSVTIVGGNGKVVTTTQTHHSQPLS